MVLGGRPVTRMFEEPLAFVVEDVRPQATFALPGLCRLMMQIEQ